jgi:hypothetical protein
MSMQLTPHFAREEFELDGKMPDECVPMYTVLCHNLIEVIRAHFGMAMEITSGYRPPAANEAAHGVKNSQHVATEDYCAADFKFVGRTDMRPCFDWVRQQTSLVWDQLIMEHDPGASDIIHISVTRTVNRRMALEGSIENLSAYTPWPVAAFSVSA